MVMTGASPFRWMVGAPGRSKTINPPRSFITSLPIIGFPYYLYGAQQDNSTIAIATRDTDEWVISDKDWYDVGGGEAGYIAPDPRDANIVYAGDGGGVVTRFDKQTEQAQNITPWPLDTSGRGAGELEERDAIEQTPAGMEFDQPD